MNYLSEYIADFYVKKKIIQQDEKEVYKYGIKLILDDIFTFSLIIIISAICWEIRYSIEFLLTFCVTRVYCGGYHAKRSYVCKTMMIITFLWVVMMSIWCKNIDLSIILTMQGVGFAILISFIPVKHPNKTLTFKQKQKNRKRGIVSYLFFGIASQFVWRYFDNVDGAIITMTLCSVTAWGILGVYMNCKEVKS